jgi:type IV pilus assembly protein PilV
MLNSHRGQTGHSLIEALVAMLVLGLGVAGLAWAQARLVLDGREANGRSGAILLAADLSDRMAFNAATAAAGGYALRWHEMPTARDCHMASCNATERAQWDLADWRSALARSLPAGNAAVFRSSADPRQIGIAIAWGRDSLASPPSAASSAASDEGACPPQQLCHVVYVQH